ncbi:MAG: hypothetical protein LUG89_02105 [Methanosphaera sp.]|nr:hypothetical protein [Methanosphaera sp.]
MYKDNIIIEYSDYPGDFDLSLTLASGQTSQPPYTKIGNKYYEVIVLDDTKILIELSQEELNDPLEINYYCDERIDEERLLSCIYYIFDLDYDIETVYDYLDNDTRLKQVYQFNKGLRLFKAQYNFESIISSICSANNSIKRWTKTITQIRQNYGEKVSYNGITQYLFPSPEKFIRIAEDELKQYGVGYRSKYMLNSTDMILQTDNFDERIEKLSYNDAYDEIIKLEGVGPKVADCILLYGYNKHEAYPVDVWINRITSHIYFRDEKTSNKKITAFAQEEFGELAGYIQLYLFNYARLSNLLEKLKPKK